MSKHMHKALKRMMKFITRENLAQAARSELPRLHSTAMRFKSSHSVPWTRDHAVTDILQTHGPELLHSRSVQTTVNRARAVQSVSRA